VRKSPGKKSRECDDPDTPPSSPINLPNSTSSDIKFQLMDVLESAKNKCITLGSFLKLAPTPPGTPYNERADLEEEESSSSSSSEDERIVEAAERSVFNNMQSFFDQIVSKLSVFASFKTVNLGPTNPPVTTSISSEDSSGIFRSRSSTGVVVKPSPVYLNTGNFDELTNELENVGMMAARFSVDEEEEDDEMTAIENGKKERQKEAELVKCSTPPPSPSKFSPPLPEMNAEAYTEEEMRKSAFVKVATLNPLINKSISIDLNSLLGSLSTLKRNQRVGGH
jgi:hypothetical protein